MTMTESPIMNKTNIARALHRAGYNSALVEQMLILFDDPVDEAQLEAVFRRRDHTGSADEPLGREPVGRPVHKAHVHARTIRSPLSNSGNAHHGYRANAVDTHSRARPRVPRDFDYRPFSRRPSEYGPTSTRTSVTLLAPELLKIWVNYP